MIDFFLTGLISEKKLRIKYLKHSGQKLSVTLGWLQKKWPLKIYARLLSTCSFHKTSILQMALEIAFLYKRMIA